MDQLRIGDKVKVRDLILEIGTSVYFGMPCLALFPDIECDDTVEGCCDSCAYRNLYDEHCTIAFCSVESMKKWVAQMNGEWVKAEGRE